MIGINQSIYNILVIFHPRFYNNIHTRRFVRIIPGRIRYVCYNSHQYNFRRTKYDLVMTYNACVWLSYKAASVGGTRDDSHAYISRWYCLAKQRTIARLLVLTINYILQSHYYNILYDDRARDLCEVYIIIIIVIIGSVCTLHFTRHVARKRLHCKKSIRRADISEFASPISVVNAIGV